LLADGVPGARQVHDDGERQTGEASDHPPIKLSGMRSLTRTTGFLRVEK
jgi:hypothetical protein